MNRTIEEQIRDMSYYVNDPHMDGFSQFEKKKQLYKIYWQARKAVENSPHFTGEEEWLEENEPPGYVR